MKKIIYVTLFSFIFLALTSCFGLNDITSLTVNKAPESYVAINEKIPASQFTVNLEAKGTLYQNKSITDPMLTVYGLVEKDGELCLDTSSVGKKTITVVYDSASIKISYFVADALIYSWEDFVDKMPTQTGIAVLMSDIRVTTVDGIEINTNLTFDLNGHKLEAIMTKSSGGSKAINITGGTLTIQDSTDINRNGTGRGKLTFTSFNTDTQNPIPTWANNTITLTNGNLILNSGIIENTSQGGATYAVDISANTKDTIFTMNGGRLIAPLADQAVRVQATHDTYWSKFKMTGGVIESGGFWLQYPGANTNANTLNRKASIEISGGEINGMIDIVSYSAQNNYVTITGNTVVNTNKLRIRSEGNTPTGKDNVQKNDVFFTINCARFEATDAFLSETYGAHVFTISDEATLQKLISISSTTQVSENLNFLKR